MNASFTGLALHDPPPHPFAGGHWLILDSASKRRLRTLAWRTDVATEGNCLCLHRLEDATFDRFVDVFPMQPAQ